MTSRAPGAVSAAHTKNRLRAEDRGLRCAALDFSLGALRPDPGAAGAARLREACSALADRHLLDSPKHMRSATSRTRPSSGEHPVLVTRQQAAAMLSMSLSHFERHVQPHLPVVRSGQLLLYRPSDLKRWADRHTTTQVSV